MNDGLPYPITDVSLLDGAAREIRRKNLKHLARPGDVMCHAPNSTPARVHYWPDSSTTDQALARAYSPDWGFIVDPDSTFLVVNVAYDNLGNAWYLVMVGGTDGRMGYVRDLVTVEDWKLHEAKYRQNWCWPRRR